MKRLLNVFSHEDVYRWFENEGVKLITQDDQCVFPQSQNAMEIVDTLKRLMYDNGVTLKTRHRIANIEKMITVLFDLHLPTVPLVVLPPTLWW